MNLIHDSESRKEFEAWADSKGLCLHLPGGAVTLAYTKVPVAMTWESWQASRVSLQAQLDQAKVVQDTSESTEYWRKLYVSCSSDFMKLRGELDQARAELAAAKEEIKELSRPPGISFKEECE